MTKEQPYKLVAFLLIIGLVFIGTSLSVYLALWAEWVPPLGIVMFLFAVFTAWGAFVALIYFLAMRVWTEVKFNWIFLLAIPFLIFNLIGALSPVTDADGSGYHLAMPKIYSQAGHFIYHPNVVSNWPMSAEMVYAAAMHFSIPPKLLHFSFGILLALLSYVICLKHFNKDVAAWAAVLVYTIPMVVLESGIAYVDLFFSFFIVFGLYLAYEGVTIGSKPQTVLSAIFLGFGASIKWSGPIFVVLATIFILTNILLKKGFKEAVAMSWYPLPGLFFCSLWYMKNWILSGAPFVPFMIARNWGTDNIAAYLGTVHKTSANIIDLVLTTWNLNFNGLGLGELTWVGPLFAAFIPLLLFKKNKPKIVKVGLWFAAIFYLIWYLTSPQSRLLLPMLVVLMMFIAYLVQINKVFKVAAAIAILSALPFAVLYNGQILWNDQFNACNYDSFQGFKLCQRNFLLEKIPAYQAYEYLNRQHQNESVLVYGDIHTYYLDSKYVWARPDMQGYITDYSDLRKYGITHVIINWDSNEFYEIKTQVFRNNLWPIYNRNGVYLFEVIEEERPRQIGS